MDGWLGESRREKLDSIRRDLEECETILQTVVKTPLNVACSDVLKGVLVRAEDSVSVQGTARIHRHDLEFSGSDNVLPQLSTLNSAIKRTAYEIEIMDQEQPVRPDIFEYIKTAKSLLLVPPTSVRFPSRFFPVTGQLGYCGEVFICEKFNVVFNLRAYQDKGQDEYVATDTVSAKSVDPGLYQVWELLERILESVKSGI